MPEFKEPELPSLEHQESKKRKIESLGQLDMSGEPPHQVRKTDQ